MFLGIDIGTSSVKAVLLDETDAVVAQTSAPLQVSRPQPGYSEQDPREWWRASVAAVRGLPAAPRAAVRAVGLSGQMHGATLLDRHDRPLRTAILWNDGRSMRECRELEAREPRAQMPRLVEGSRPSATLSAAAAAELQLSRVVVAGGAGDNAASAAGMGVISPGQAFLSLGTSGVLFIVTDQFRPNPDRGAHAFCHCLPERWHQMSVMLSAASALDWVAQLTAQTDLVRLAQAAESRGLQRHSPIFLPYLNGERTPHNDPYCRGMFFGLSADTTPADLAAAVMEGVAFAFADGLEVLLEKGGTVGDISVTGGGARLPYWGKLLAAALQRPLTYRRNSEIGAALGAARLGRLALSGERPETVCTAPAMEQVVRPDAELAALLAMRRPLFVRLYQELKASFLEHSA